MSHEPECLIGHQFPNQIVVECYECGRLRAAYQRGAADEREKAGQREKSEAYSEGYAQGLDEARGEE